MEKFENLVVGCSGSIGIEFAKILNNHKTLFLSRKKPKSLNLVNWKYQNLDKKLNRLPKKVKTIYFLSSPHYIKKNMSEKILKKELIWIQKILKYFYFNQFIYFSSSSVYLKNHKVGVIKKKCEMLLKTSKIKKLQIWRPFNIVGNYENKLSDHFHNLLIKNFIIKKKKSFNFLGNDQDERGYSSANKFAKLVVKYANFKNSFILNYGNKNTITVNKIAFLFKKLMKKKYKREIDINFKEIKKNINTLNSIKNVKTIESKENSKNILKDYFYNF
jgi:nucleoside-diphosphate-sugar epimerase